MAKEEDETFVKNILGKAKEKYEPAKPTSMTEGVDTQKIDDLVKNIREKIQKEKK